ncbi:MULTISPECIES: coiled-coil domain-containing protein [Streptomycetaceae]|uniref:Uncharacterized protein n=1 Tax=Streptantibioticus cattleyicolor (strain ATCC 35852 / DSM 46488 / JCM 4925 / NBRC 14057 / NRRL 8057) TaxID=1003195 RepID=F8JYU2_STREN|nr:MULTISPECIES: hypothetical protein [Streptomycetaceae]AEW94049.1 hypothetical protein SCATT_16780 [Streptantibioticus cattleyicolor NRRL 8057 = DSM 46488]MYS58722.1 hypothetical protein [Streptomyces sp. SID5468]CCB74401.1 protein of unknown function [Streptantibioticus cattleyicolor NRRL 8057 = DSM 46488]
MGRQVRDRKTGQTTWQGGLLNQVNGIASDLMGKGGKGAVPQLMAGFVEGMTTLVGWLKKVASFLNGHPQLVSGLKEAAKLVGVIAPLTIAFGTTAKIFGKLIKLSTPLVSTLVGGGKIIGQFMAGGLSMLNGTGFRNGYVSQRGLFNGGDTRSVARRAVDKVTGNNSQEERLRINIAQYKEQMEKAKAEAQELRDKIRELNRQDLNHLARQAAGSDSSVQAAARRAAEATEAAKVAVGNLDRAKLAGLRGQFTSSATTTGELDTAVKAATNRVNKLNGRSLDSLKGQFSHVKNETDETIKKASSLTGRVSSLNERKLSAVTDQVQHLGRALADAGVKAEALNLALDHIGKKAPGKGDGPAVHKPNKYATGGVVPG